MSKGRRRSKIQVAEHKKQALAMKLSGARLDEISAALGISVSQVSKDVNAAIKEIPEEEAALVREQELMRLDRMQRGVWKDAIGGNVNAIDRVLRIQDRRARYLGLDTLKVSHSFDVAAEIRNQFSEILEDPELDDDDLLDGRDEAQ